MTNICVNNVLSFHISLFCQWNANINIVERPSLRYEKQLSEVLTGCACTNNIKRLLLVVGVNESVYISFRGQWLHPAILPSRTTGISRENVKISNWIFHLTLGFSGALLNSLNSKLRGAIGAPLICITGRKDSKHWQESTKESCSQKPCKEQAAPRDLSETTLTEYHWMHLKLQIITVELLISFIQISYYENIEHFNKIISGNLAGVENRRTFWLACRTISKQIIHSSD